MKTKLMFILIGLGMFTFKSYGQFSFGVSPGISFTSAYFGYKVNKNYIPNIGFQYVNANFKYENTGQEWNFSKSKFEDFTNTDKFSAGLFIPNIGIKYFLKQKNKLQPYFSLTLSKPIVTGKYKYNDDEDEDINEIFKNTKLWGGEFGFGTEYFFDENFSIGGEFGIRYLHIKSTYTYMEDVYNGKTFDYEEIEFKDEYKVNMNPTFSKFTLNFYF